jgi:hypothetical protein
LIALSAEACTSLVWIKVSPNRQELFKGKHGDAALNKTGKWVTPMSHIAASVLSRADF